MPVYKSKSKRPIEKVLDSDEETKSQKGKKAIKNFTSVPKSKSSVKKPKSYDIDDEEDSVVPTKSAKKERNDPIEPVSVVVFDQQMAMSLFEEQETGNSVSKMTPESAREFYQQFSDLNYKIPIYYYGKQSYTPNGELIKQYCIVQHETGSSTVSISFEIFGHVDKNASHALNRLQCLISGTDYKIDKDNKKNPKSKKPGAWQKFFVYVDNETNTPQFHPLKEIIPYAFRKSTRFDPSSAPKKKKAVTTETQQNTKKKQKKDKPKQVQLDEDEDVNVVDDSESKISPPKITY